MLEREECGTTNVALVCLEPIDPFVFDRIAKNDAKYSNAENYLGAAKAKVSWIVGSSYVCIERSVPSSIVFSFSCYRNIEAYSFVNPRIMTFTREISSNEKRRVSAAHDIFNGVFGNEARDMIE